MKLPKDQSSSIMRNVENSKDPGSPTYFKTSSALNILRETIMGRETFDKAFKTYAKRWAFKHPEPADFFRTMEDASGEDLDWFWRGWFYGKEPVDIIIDKVTVAIPDLESFKKATKTVYKLDKPIQNEFENISKIRNRQDKNIIFYVEKDKDVQDFYYRYNRGEEKVDTTKEYTYQSEGSQPLSKKDQEKFKDITAYQIDFVNKGGLVMPIILEFTFEDGTKLYDKSSAQIWQFNEQKVSKIYYFDRKLKSIQLDPMRETADIDTTNNQWNNTELNSQISMFQVFKQKQNAPTRGGSNGKINPMQVAEHKK